VWAVRDQPPGFRQRYFSAFAARALVDVDEARDIIDSVRGSDSMAAVQAARSASDFRRWLAGKLIAELGDRLEINGATGPVVNLFLPAKDGTRGPVIEGRAVELDGSAELLEGPDSADADASRSPHDP
jgi:hypothetical protein